jgi:flagellar motility protein MotE (MotC chaperone)
VTISIGTHLFRWSAYALAGVLMYSLAQLWLEHRGAQNLSGGSPVDGLLSQQASRIFGQLARKSDGPEIVTGATDAPPSKSEGAGAEPAKPSAAEAAMPVEDNPEKALLEKLSARRETLDRREAEMTEREAVLSAAEKQVEARMAELKAMDEQLKADLERNNAARDTIKPFVVMYETMKPKDAARIFEKLEQKAVLPIIAAMNPKKFSEILAQMEPVIAGKVTMGLAAFTAPKSGGQAPNADLPELPDLPTAPVR